jgi:hypothetical protein
LFNHRFLLITLSTKFELEKLDNFSVKEIQVIAEQPALLALARFCFNVHFISPPSQTNVKGWRSVPLVRIGSEAKIDMRHLVSIVTRHELIDARAAKEMQDKNRQLNFNDDIMLLDKQGLVFHLRTSDTKEHRNRYRRIAELFEFLLYCKSCAQSLKEQPAQEFLEDNEIGEINDLLTGRVLQESVSARRGWELLKKELAVAPLPSRSYRNKTFPETRNVDWAMIGAIVAVMGLVIALIFNLY